MFKWRHIFILCLIGIAGGALIYELIKVQFSDHKFLAQQGDARVVRTIQKHAYRGSIVDRNGYPLALSTPVDAIWVNPKHLSLDDQKFHQVLSMLAVSQADSDKLINKIKNRKGKTGFIYLKRQVDPYIAQKIENMSVSGIYLQREYKRYYPDAEVIAHIVGFTNIDNKGQEGIELLYNDWLDGSSGYQKIWRDVKGNRIRKLENPKVAKNGNNLALSIDHRIQYIAYKLLKEGVKETNAVGGSIIIMDVKTGEIIAMVNQPSYNPNNMKTAYPENRRNRSITDVFEPGSVIKTFAATAGLKSGQYNDDSIVDTSPGYYYLDRKVIRDFRNYGKMDLRHILLKSSNVGISKIVLSIPANLLGDTLREFGFGSASGVEFPGERSGYVPSPRKWGDFPLATLSFGYGMNITALQLARAYAVFGNHGKMVTPTLLKRYNGENIVNRQIISDEIAASILSMLNSVVEGSGGTGSKAKIWGYHIAGKTGTVRKAIKGGYATDNYMAFFAGIAPATNPRLVAVVTIDDPKGDNYGGGSVAAPIFAKLMTKVLKVLNITPDKIQP